MASFPKKISSIFMIIIIIFNLHTKPTETSAKTCPQTHCSPTLLTVKFPFQIVANDHDGDQIFQEYYYKYSRCGYPGFELSCKNNGINNQSDAVLSLPSGDFAVRMIIYKDQMLTIDDPNNCLPKSFLDRNFTVSGTPFRVENLGSFTFLNCSPSDVSGAIAGAGVNMAPVACLSGDGYTVVATPTVLLESSPASCRVISTAMVPVTSSERWWMEDWEFYLRSFVGLTWQEPSCRDCEVRGGDCGFSGDTAGLEIGCFNLPQHGLSKGVQYALYLIGGLVILGFLFFNYQAKGHLRQGNARVYIRQPPQNHESRQPNYNSEASINVNLSPEHVINGRRQSTVAVATTGPDSSVIESYPKTLAGESRRLLKSSDYVACAICLSEYQPKDSVRTLPDCFHYFHADCIDEWLRLNASCPLCRNSPLVSHYSTLGSATPSDNNC